MSYRLCITVMVWMRGLWRLIYEFIAQNWPSNHLWLQTYCLRHIFFLFLAQMWEDLQNRSTFLFIKQIATHGRGASWTVDTIWTLGSLGRIYTAMHCACSHASILFLLDRVCMNYFYVSLWCLWVVFIFPEWSSETKFHSSWLHS